MGACCKCFSSDGDDKLLGDKSTSNKTSLQSPVSVSIDSFTIERVLGRGAFGKVFLVTKKDTGHLYAMKVLKKEMLEQRNQITNTKTEREIMGGVDHPFIVQLRFAFQTADKLYMLMDFINGGSCFSICAGRSGSPRRRPDSMPRRSWSP